MSSKQVNFNDGGNSTKEFEKVSDQDKGSIWYSKEEKELNRAELMVEQGKALVTKTVLEMEEHRGQTEDSEQVQAAVQTVLDQGVDGVIDFLAKHGQGMQLPTYPRASAPPAEGGSAMTGEETATADEQAKQQVRELVRLQVVVLMQSGVASFVSQEDLEKKTDEIMKLPRMEILRFLEQKPTLPASKNPVKPPAPYNWMNDGKHAWEDLPIPVQEAAKVLGYDAESWVTKVQPEQSDKVWEDLSEAQQQAAIRIGFNSFSWDGIEPSEQEDSERYMEDSDSSSSESDDSDDDEETKEFIPEEAMKNQVRALVKEKLLEASAFNEDNVDPTVEAVMELPKPQIMAFLKHPLPEEWTKPQEDETEVEESESNLRDSFMRDNSFVFSNIVLTKDEDDDKPMDDDSSTDEEEEPQQPQRVDGNKSDDEETDEFLSNFFSEEDKENIKKDLQDIETTNETTPLIPGKSLPNGDDDPKKGPSMSQVGLIGLGIAIVGWFAFKKMR